MGSLLPGEAVCKEAATSFSWMVLLWSQRYGAALRVLPLAFAWACLSQRFVAAWSSSACLFCFVGFFFFLFASCLGGRVIHLWVNTASVWN